SHDKFSPATPYRNVLPARIHMAARRHSRHRLPGVPVVRRGIFLRLFNHASHGTAGNTAGRGPSVSGRDTTGRRLESMAETLALPRTTCVALRLQPLRYLRAVGRARLEAAIRRPAGRLH